MSIRYKILSGMLVALTVTALSFTFLWYRNATDMAHTYLEDMSESIMTDAYTAFEYLLTDTEYMIALVSTNQNSIVTPLKNINQVELNQSGQLGSDYLENRRIIKAFLSAMNGYKYYIVGLCVISSNGYVFQTSNIVKDSESLFEMIAEAERSWPERKMRMLAPMATTSTWFNMHSNFVVPAVRTIMDDRQQIIGYTILYFDYSVIEDIFSKNLPEGSVFQVIDQQDNLIYSNCSNELIDMNATSDDGNVYHRFDAPRAGWRFLMGIPSAPILSKASSTLWNTTLLFIVTMVFSIALCVYISSRITRNVAVLRGKMQLVGNGNLTVNKNIKSRDEIGQMENTFNKMVERIQGLMDAVTEEEKQKRLVEIAFLQTQINPHFISNALNLIAWMAKVQHAENIVPLTQALNTMLRGAMKRGDDLIPLRDEIINVRSFLEIIEYTGNYDFETVISIASEVEDKYILRFLLQPIVENAVYHGLRTQLTRDSCLSIRASQVDKALQVIIEDNGVGITPEQIDKLLHQKPDAANGFSGVGIQNVVERIRLFFGEDYGLRYESEPGHYTRAILVLPLIDLPKGGLP